MTRKIMKHFTFGKGPDLQNMLKQECIPVGFVPSALYRMGEGGLCPGVSVREIPPVNRITDRCKQVAFQLNANHPLAENMGYIKFEEM